MSSPPRRSKRRRRSDSDADDELLIRVQLPAAQRKEIGAFLPGDPVTDWKGRKAVVMPELKEVKTRDRVRVQLAGTELFEVWSYVGPADEFLFGPPLPPTRLNEEALQKVLSEQKVNVVDLTRATLGDLDADIAKWSRADLLDWTSSLARDLVPQVTAVCNRGVTAAQLREMSEAELKERFGMRPVDANRVWERVCRQLPVLAKDAKDREVCRLCTDRAADVGCPLCGHYVLCHACANDTHLYNQLLGPDEYPVRKCLNCNQLLPISKYIRRY